MKLNKSPLFIVLSLSLLIISCSSDSPPTDSNDSDNEESPTYSVTKKSSPSDGGSIDTTPDKNSYEEGETVTVTANPEDGWEFGEWSGDISGTENPIEITIDSDLNLVADFEELLIPDKYHGLWWWEVPPPEGVVDYFVIITKDKITFINNLSTYEEYCLDTPRVLELSGKTPDGYVLKYPTSGNEYTVSLSDVRDMGPDGSGDVWTEITIETDFLEYTGDYFLETRDIPTENDIEANLCE